MRPLLFLVALELRERHDSSSRLVNRADVLILLSAFVRELLEGRPTVYVLEIDDSRRLASAC